MSTYQILLKQECGFVDVLIPDLGLRTRASGELDALDVARKEIEGFCFKNKIIPETQYPKLVKKKGYLTSLITIRSQA